MGARPTEMDSMQGDDRLPDVIVVPKHCADRDSLSEETLRAQYSTGAQCGVGMGGMPCNATQSCRSYEPR